MFAINFHAFRHHFTNPSRGFAVDAEIVAAVALLSAALVVGLATVGDYGITVDEFNADDYGPKALAWYMSGFTDRSHFETVEDTLWFYGPWFHMLTAFVQSFQLANWLTVRHAMTFLTGLVGLAAFLPIGRMAFGRWAGLTAIGLCLTTGYLYGSIFFTPIDVPFLFAMSWATVAIIAMARRVVPSWPATISTALLTGLAIATRTGGVITHVYLLGALLLCALEAVVHHGHSVRGDLLRIGGRFLCVVIVAWPTAIALWPWLQIGNPLSQFKTAFVYFANHPASFEFPHWGKMVRTTDLPATYIVAQLSARLPEAFLGLLAIGILLGIVQALAFSRVSFKAFQQRGTAGFRAAALVLARSRNALIVWASVLLPIGFLVVQHSTQYDGLRHVLFVIPMLAVLAGAALMRLLPLLRRVPLIVAAVGGSYVGFMLWTLAMLHPLEYAATNIFAGRTAGSYGRFDLDYWSVAATTALRRLERQFDRSASDSFSAHPPSIMICIPFRELSMEGVLGRPWRLEDDPVKADFIIETERWRCAQGTDAVLIDEVRRFDRAFAWTYARPSSASD